MDTGQLLKNNSTHWHLAIVILFACAINYPCLIWGLQAGDDRSLHVTYLHYFDQQLSAGDVYPQWISDLNLGAGSPIFYVQYPLPYYVSAALRHIFFLPATAQGDARALGLFLFASGILAGIFCWLWCSRIADRKAALPAALVYLTMPYLYGFDLYHRSAIGEYWALAWVPLAFYFLHDLDDDPLRAVSGTAFAYAMILLGHPFTAILCTPFIVVYAVCCATKKSYAAAYLAGAAVLLGIGVSGFYFFPMMQQRFHFDAANLVRLRSGNFNYAQHLFPFGNTLFPVDRAHWLLFDLEVVCLALLIGAIVAFQWRGFERPLLWKVIAGALILTVLLACLSPVLSSLGFQIHPDKADPEVIAIRSRVFLITFLTMEIALLAFISLRDSHGRLPYFFAISSLACFFLTTRWSSALWERLKFLRNVQFPWRFDGLLTIFAAGLLAVLFAEILTRYYKSGRRILLVLAGIWLVLGIGTDLALGMRTQFTHPIPATLIDEVEVGYPAYAMIDHLPLPEELGSNDGLSSGARVIAGEGSASLVSLSPRHKKLEARCAGDCTVLLRQVYYPTWTADEGEHGLELRGSEIGGLTELKFGTGSHVVDLELPHSRLERAGGFVSLLSVAAVLAIFWGSGLRKPEKEEKAE